MIERHGILADLANTDDYLRKGSLSLICAGYTINKLSLALTILWRYGFDNRPAVFMCGKHSPLEASHQQRQICRIKKPAFAGFFL